MQRLWKKSCHSWLKPPWTQQFLGLCLLLLSLASATVKTPAPLESQRKTQYSCLGETRNAPCLCTEKQKGLDVTCERTTLEAVNETLQQLPTRYTHQMKIYYLTLRNLPIIHLPDYIFEGLDIKHLTIIYANLSSIEERAFAGLDKHLESLDLSQNSLKTFPNKALKNLGKLVHLNLNHNNITFIHAGALDGLTNLLRVTLYGNGITGLDDNALTGASSSLMRIVLGNNVLEAFPINALRSLKSLEGLEIQENSIQQLAVSDFYGLERLDNINLASNEIRELKSETFRHLNALNLLDLGSNQIEKMDKDTFVGVEDTLEWLVLGGNRLNSFSNHALKKLTKLRQLDLHSNGVTSIPEDAFEDFGGQLKTLSLNNNSISQIPANAFNNLHLLQWLNLHENKLTEIPQETFQSVFDTLTTLTVHDNPLVCDCKLSWFRAWTESQGRQILREFEKIQCQEPPNFRGQPIQNVQAEYMTCPMTKGTSTSAAVSLGTYSSVSLAAFLLAGLQKVFLLTF